MSGLTAQVTRTAVGVLCASLVGIGVVTAGLLHVRALHALDQALLAAAYAEAHPWQEERFGNDYVRSPVQVRPWVEGDLRVEQSVAEEAVRQERPVWRTFEGWRQLLLVVEPNDAGEREAGHDHFLVVAEAAAITPWDVAFPFLGIYLVVSVAVAVAAGLGIRRGMVRALEPVEAAARDLEAVQGLGSGARVTPTGAAEVDRLLVAANHLLDRLDAAFSAQSSFTAQAAHELRTPITVLLGELELALRRERSPDAYREALSAARTQARRLEELVDGLMVLARVESGHADRGRSTEYLSQAVHQALRQERASLEAAGCEVTVVLANDPEVSMHVSLVAVAVGNLLRNVARHAPGAPVRVEVDVVGNQGVVRVLDGGEGLSESQCHEVLERFSRGSRRRDGLGLGLTMAREIARRHGGDLTLSPRSPRGLAATLTVALTKP